MRLHMKEALAWTVGGPQGSGVDTAANLFARACAFAGFHVFGKREYYSNIMGKHSYFQVRVHPTREVRASTEMNHLLTSFDAETPMKHFRYVVPGGGIIYDPNELKTKVDHPPNMEYRYKAELKAFLAEQGRGDTLEDVLNVAAENGVRLYPVPYEQMFKNLGEITGISDYARLSKTQNTMAVAASLALLGLDRTHLIHALEDQFKGRKRIIDMNVAAVNLIYDYMTSTFDDDFILKLEPPKEKPGPRVYIMGTQASALGKIAAGIGIQTYYPISPATDESVFLESHENVPLVVNGKWNQGFDRAGVVVVQTEDEIAAMTMATGAAIGGARASTATSGPGFCLMVEAIGWAGINEVPVVVTLYQRGGPSTGLPTRTEQGDLWFAIHHGHSEIPRIVLASGDHEECFYDAIHAFNLAEKYQVPVIHMIDKYLANSTATYPVFDLNQIRLDRGRFLSDEELAERYSERPFERFELSDDGVSPRTRPGQPYGIHWMTGDEHDELGHITEDVVIRQRQMDKRMRKLETILRETPEELKYQMWDGKDHRLLIISWGSNKGVILEAKEQLAQKGLDFAFLQLKMLWPFDRERYRSIISRYETVICIEQNYSGQMADLIQRETHIPMENRIVKYNGRPIMLEELVEAIENLVNNPKQKVVLTHGI